MIDKTFKLKGKVGEIVYPHYNGTASFWKKPRWDLVTEVNKDGKIIEFHSIQDYSTVRAIQLIALLLIMERDKKCKNEKNPRSVK